MDAVRARQRENAKIYYERNKEKILEKRREKYQQQKSTPRAPVPPPTEGVPRGVVS
jgi:hypothetical protein